MLCQMINAAIDGLRFEREKEVVIEFKCPVCKREFVRVIDAANDEGSLVRVAGSCRCFPIGSDVRVR